MTPEQEEDAARACLSAPVFAFVAGAAGSSEWTRRANRQAWDRIYLRHELPADVSTRSTATTVLGASARAPFAVAPMGNASAVWPRGEIEIAAACAHAGIPMVVSTMSGSTLEDIAATGADLAFQLYWLRDAVLRRELVIRAEHAACTAIVVTVDTPFRRGTEREAATEFTPPPGSTAMTRDTTIDASLNWSEIEALTARTTLPVYLKGVLSAAVADRARQAGCAGVVVSNHGGRQFDAAVPTAVALSEVARTVPECAPVGGFDVMADSGIRTGTDVCKALALGASSVMVGRQVLYGLARGGRHGVSDVLHRITREFDTALAMTGCRNVADAGQLRAGIFDGPAVWEFAHDAGRLGR